MFAATATYARAPGGGMRAPGSQCNFTVLAISAMRGQQNVWLAARHFSEFMQLAPWAACTVNSLHRVGRGGGRCRGLRRPVEEDWRTKAVETGGEAVSYTHLTLPTKRIV